MISRPTSSTNKSSSCIGLIFSSNASLTPNCGIEKSIYEKPHHNIIYEALNFKIPLPSPYYQEVWDTNVRILKILKSLLFYCKYLKGYFNIWLAGGFQAQNSKRKMYVFAATLRNIFHNFIPHETKNIDYKSPERISSAIISSLRERKKLLKTFYKNPSDFNKNVLFFHTNKALFFRQKQIISLKSVLNCTIQTWNIYKLIVSRFLNKKNVPTIPPVLDKRDRMINLCGLH